MQKKRLFKMKDIREYNMLIVALGDLFKTMQTHDVQREVIRKLVLHIAQIGDRGKLYLSDEEFLLARNALLDLRNLYLANGRYSDGIDDVLLKLMNSKYRRYKEIA